MFIVFDSMKHACKIVINVNAISQQLSTVPPIKTGGRNKTSSMTFPNLLLGHAWSVSSPL